MSPAPGWKKVSRARTAASFTRRAGTRQPKPLVLIVCEDSVSSPGYFRDLKAHLRIATVDVEIHGEECDSAPISVVDHAIRTRKERKRQGHTIDVVYCVLDVDEHATLAKARDKARAHDLRCIVSSPCFELWYLVHFEAGDRPYKRCDQLIARLRVHLPDYEKGRSRPFERTWSKVDVALGNSRRLTEAHEQDPGRLSHTNLHELIEHLRVLATQDGRGTC